MKRRLGVLGVLAMAFFAIAGPATAQPRETPLLALHEPVVRGTWITVNGLTLPRGAATAVTRLEWDWGDGAVAESWFPATHAYDLAGTYRVTVTAFQDDGASAAQELEVITNALAERAVQPFAAFDGRPGAAATRVTFHDARVEPAGSGFRLDVAYALDGANSGGWRARVHYLQWCRDADGTPTGSATGTGGLVSGNEAVLMGESGRIVLEFSASIVSDDPALTFPVTCSHVVPAFWQDAGGAPGSVTVGPPIAAVTEWVGSVNVVGCEPPCLGW
jgi:hypothetical protein